MTTAPRLSPDLIKTLTMAAEVIAPARDDWWIISSAAVALHGVKAIQVGDVDVLMSLRDATALLRRLGTPPEDDGGNERFRSNAHGRWRQPPLALDVMAGLQVRFRGEWRDVAPRSRLAVTIGGHRLFVPERTELADLLLLFGRPKDLERHRLLTGT
ncbi:hypothetical protein [Consotaella aegiceratis]|uniref:hypothetical protein n=1 Tax=Consotaella aegiceratis TaxID=3097961 RepID=UPI002F3FAC5E